MELRNLATGTVRSWQEIEAFLFSPDSSYLVLKRRRPEAAGGGNGRGGAGASAGGPPTNASGAPVPEPKGPRGADVILLDLRTGRYQLLGSVGDLAFAKTGDLLAYTVDAATADANGLFVFDTRRGRVTPLDNDAKTYNRLAWSDDGTALAVLKGVEVEKMRERDNVLLAIADVPSAVANPDAAVKVVTLDPKKAEGFPSGWVVSDRAPLKWSDDDQRVFFGIKEQVPAPSTERKSHDEAADVDVWNTADERIQSVQMIRAEQDRNFTFTQVFDVSADRFVRLADATMRDLDVAEDGRWAVGRDTRGYIGDYKRPAADLYRVNTATGERTLMLKGQIINTSTGSHTFGISPDGRDFLYWRDQKFQAYDLDAGASTTLAAAEPGELRRHRLRSSRPEAGVRRRGLHERREGRHRRRAVRPVAAAARRLGAQEPDRRRRREERDPVPLRPDRAGRPAAHPGAPEPGPGGPAARASSAGAPPRARSRSTSRSRSRSRRSGSGRRRRASTSWRTGS